MTRIHESQRNASIAGRLIAKDLLFYRGMIVTALVAGVVSLVVSHYSDGDNVRTGLNAGIVLFITTMMAYAIFVAMVGILKERQDRSQLFVLSLPVSPAQYSFAKVSSALIAFLLPWMVLTAGVIVTTVASDRPRGGIPFFLVMMTLFLVNFSVLMAVVVITMSEVWATVAILVTNVSATLFLGKAGRLLGMADRSSDAAATWSPQVVTALCVEIALILLALGLAYFVPSRKQDAI